MQMLEKQCWQYRIICLLLCLISPMADAQSVTPNPHIGEQYITDWLVLGPFFGDKETDFLGDEANTQPEVGHTITTAEGTTVMWKRYRAKGSVLDLTDAIGGHENAVAYVF